MPKKQKEEKKEKKGKYIYIKLDRPLNVIMDEYCGLMGISPQDVGFQLGFIVGKGGEEAAKALASVNQMFFYAGMSFALTHKKDFEWKFLSKKPQFKKNIEEIKKEIQKAEGIGPEIPSYMG